ncbi:hypothetical protein A3H80_01135 [Candidatus Roizmanbacteria bacterium RIFCSPLOWO2_02_FULL_37_19]|uniref:ABC transporter domain-containing protein n=1 Tax=Candidatus Roizmanbacteria bacterium RIFCSPHIGHO2_02_FULL_37_24 TaxID=1802037 RepID=A0A1F7GUN6_9BACT|nr:MAG: hypothetical protein A2862_00660 [Candidatus Roizmanbacteria bacterium RIFCSPHIGHO2_01_FULL_38_41]OGK22541.1 MAG: hypothetical protein A3C24_05255 [Candidatus Roizmanbacteria bacterium RIFCSPHIGHO2_02_FULL_37_24]OGK33941.1 MAG: hypothetical protein A3E10_02040 [Candidatus Roizmanbacteria bacterium RIFCSPHIGHO2_12_FULL_37_23]OGK43641.1 MAG: hypothetical protein A2956_04025 [Candidatus Roizmanbacteria bacterium RIFCSPLOWO2_01_FULL_37_57]OGK54204.1 MAG: hypothetical protein A3H80_01135 [Ca
MHPVLDVHNVVKKYGEFTAVNGISFSIEKGEVVGLLGANGAGKTTTIQMLLGITEQTSGSIFYFGKDFAQHRQESLQKINFTTAYGSLQGRITVHENLKVFGGLYAVPNLEQKIQELVQRLEIENVIYKQYWGLSSGEKTRVNLVKSFINDPQLILMDEPTASLDPDIADKVLDFIDELRKEKGVSILFTSHDMNEVSHICDRVIFLDHGNIIAMDTPLGLTKHIKTSIITLTFDAQQQDIASYLNEHNIKFSFPRKEVVHIEVDEELIPKVLFGFSKRKIWITDIDIKKPNLEDVFLEVARKGKYVFHKD